MFPGIGASKRIIGMPGDFVLRNSPEAGSEMMIQVREFGLDGNSRGRGLGTWDCALIIHGYRCRKDIAGLRGTIYHFRGTQGSMDHYHWR